MPFGDGSRITKAWRSFWWMVGTLSCRDTINTTVLYRAEKERAELVTKGRIFWEETSDLKASSNFSGLNSSKLHNHQPGTNTVFLALGTQIAGKKVGF